MWDILGISYSREQTEGELWGEKAERKLKISGAVGATQAGRQVIEGRGLDEWAEGQARESDIIPDGQLPS